MTAGRNLLQSKNLIKTQNTYTTYKPIIRKHKYRQIAMDLVHIIKYKNQNNGYWILCGFEILSKYAFVIPVYRKDTSNMTKAVTELVKQFKNRFGEYPNLVQFDDGKEFYNVGF